MHKIVIIEDDEVIRYNMTEILRFHAYEVSSFSNGNLALSAIRNDRPHLVLCDILIPGMSGYDLFLQLKASAETAFIPFIFVTATADIRKGMEMGADDYLVKPFTAEALLLAIKTRLSKVEREKEECELRMHRRLGDFSKMFSHEYNTPLNAIIGLSELLLSRAEPISMPNLQEYIMAIRESGLRMKKTNDKLVEFLKLWTGNVTRSAFEPLSVQEILQKLSEIARSEACSGNRTEDLLISKQSSAANNFGLISSPALSSILSELIENAFKFSEKGTKVTLNAIENPTALTLIIVNEPSPVWNDKAAEMSLSRYKQGLQGFGIGLSIVNKTVELYQLKFQLTKQEDRIEARLEIPVF